MGIRPRYWLPLVGLGLPILGLIAVVVIHRTIMAERLVELDAAFLTQAQLDRLIADQRRIAAADIFPPPTSDRDAGELLNPLIKLDGGTPTQRRAIAPPWWGGRALMDQTRGPRDELPPPERRPWLVSPEYMRQGDFSILADLLAYDHWETSAAGGRYAQYLATDDHPFLPSSPIPNLVDLQTLARLRLAKGLAGDGAEMRSALVEVRHLARLTHSTDWLVASMVAVALLTIERRGFEAAIQRGLLPHDAWEPVTDEQKHAMRRAGFGMVMVAMGWVQPADAHSQLAALGIPLFNRCGGLTEAVAQHHMIYPFWDGLPGERDLSFLSDRVRTSLSEATECRIPVARQVMAHPEWMSMSLWTGGSRFKSGAGTAEVDAGGVYAVPFLRGPAFLGERFYAKALANFRMYGDTPADDWRGQSRKR
jgi:hypothetical protein